jgi:probable rRNA maturation factor
MTGRARGRLIVTVSNARGRRLVAAGLDRWLRKAAPPRARGHVSIALISDAEMRRLNAVYRRKNRPTDVLSFPADASGIQTGGDLGDLAIAIGVARRQAREFGHSLQTELRILALHGLLHLLGYDHESDQGEMHRVEERLRRQAGLTHGLIGRGRGASRR